MRMRRKKHREDRMANCSELIVEDISLFKDGAEKGIRQTEIRCA